MILVFASLAGLAVSYIWGQRYLQDNKWDTIPNAHFSVPYPYWWLLWLKLTGREHHTRYIAHQKHGPVIRLGPNEISINAGVQTVYSHFEKGAWFSVFKNNGHPFMFSMIANKEHAERRRMLAPVYTKSYIQHSRELTNILDVIISRSLIPQLHGWAQDGTMIDIHHTNKALMLDLGSAYVLGLGNGTDIFHAPADKDLIKELELGKKAVFCFADVPTFTKWAMKLGIPPVSSDVRAFEKLEESFSKLCENAKEIFLSNQPQAEHHPTVYSQFRQKFEASDATLSDELDPLIASELMDHIQAAHETTGITLTFLMWELSRDSQLLLRLRKEISELASDEPSAQAIDKLPFLDDLVIERLRRYPASPGPFPRVVPVSGARIAGFDIPLGTTVSASAYALHRNADVFHDPEDFFPDRWIKTTPETKREMLKWFWVFGSGGRMYIGNHLAMRIKLMKAVIVTVYREFDVEICAKEKVKPVDGFLGMPVGNVVMPNIRNIDLSQIE